ncbi:2TM domain-containing protein [Chryseobacterium lactis]|uniref:2TM domain-containing protein n=1 Tax=Chryseobacterium lactis TaxID=1241981 RepID=UPI001625A6EE|nr:2TM domain-containing protein [Chryseobacterium lactis]
MNTYKTYNRVQQLKKFYKNLMWFGIITVILIGKDWLQDDLQYTIFGGHLLLAIWTIVLLFKGISLFIFNNEWERKMLEKETAKN